MTQRQKRINDLKVIVSELQDEGHLSDARLMKLMEAEDELKELQAEERAEDET